MSGAIAADELVSEVIVDGGDVHDQEREVVADVGDPQCGVELDAVDDFHTAAEEDVLRAQVTVPITDEARRRAFGQQRGEGVQPGTAEAGERRQSRSRCSGVGQAGERFLDDGVQRLRIDALDDGRLVVERGDGGADRHHHQPAGGALVELRAEGVGFVVAAHDDGVVDGGRVVLRRDLHPASRPRGDRHHAPVHAGRETPAEVDLRVAELPAQGG